MNDQIKALIDEIGFEGVVWQLGTYCCSLRDSNHDSIADDDAPWINESRGKNALYWNGLALSLFSLRDRHLSSLG